MSSLSLFPPDDNPQKTCTGPCGRTLPATPEFFPRRKSAKIGLYPQCKECGRKRRKAYRLEHPEKEKAYHEKHLKEISEYKKQYRETHYEQRKSYDAEHKEQIHQNRKLYTERNRERISDVHRQYCEQYYQTEHGRMQMRVSSHNRRARKRSAEGSYTLVELQEQYARQKGHCYYCKKKLGKSRNSYHADHIVPLAKGGTNYIVNIVLACSMCNQSKQDKMLHEWENGGRLL